MGNKRRHRRVSLGHEESRRRQNPGRRSEGLSQILNSCQTGDCGEEAACKQVTNDTYKCVCPHDNSEPTKDFRCPKRITVPLTPVHIHNIIPPSSNNISSVNSSSSHFVTAIPPTIQHIQKPASSNALVIGMLALGAVVLLFASFTICLWKRKTLAKCLGLAGMSRKPSASPSPVSLTKGLLLADRYTPNPHYSTYTSQDAIPVPLLPRDTIKFLQEIGEGCFGKVFKGEMTSTETEETEIVAIKVLKESATREAEEDFMREVDIMSTFRHSNILSLIGVVLRESGGSPWMVFEFMPHGDLAEVLRSNNRQFWKPVPHLLPLNKEDLLNVAFQISAGMSYLASQRFVHRDLACRNCLVGSGLVVKIADFGMSRDVYTCDYYKIGGSRMLPVRWMSPESVTYGRFTLESDVWSYGVVLWEIYSLGKQPYYGHCNEEVVKLILQGIMLIPPEDCPTIICDLMRSCWKTEPRDRIKFSQIHDILLRAKERLTSQRPSTTDDQPLPRPPQTVPVAHFENVELLDMENYLLPNSPSPSKHEYLQPLPDL